jgi:pimeloyl-ACP methyl ester carboxylesterase
MGCQLAEDGFDVYSMDLLGHGKSDGISGDMDFDDCLSSINEVIEKIKGTTRIFILAHSIGCTFALWYAHNFKGFVDGLILMAPYIRISGVRKRSDAEPGIFYFLYLIARRLLTPKYLVKMTEVLPQLNKIGGEEIGFMLQKTDLNFYYTYRYIVDIIAFRNSKVKSLTDIGEMPVLFLHGKRDSIFYPVISEIFFKLLKSTNKEIILFDCDHWFYDAVSYIRLAKYSEDSRTQVIAAIKKWINRIKS